MSYYDPEFYDEPSEFEQQVEEFKSALVKSVKTEYINEIDRLRKENSQLQETKRNFESIKNEYKNKENQLKIEKEQMERTVRQQRLADLMKDFNVIMYQAKTKEAYKSKCNKCDENRQIHFCSPSGKEMTEQCECAKYKNKYIPTEHYCYEFRLDNYNNNNKMLMWFKMKHEDDYDWCGYESSTLAKTVYNSDMKFEDMDHYTYFQSKEDCQKYCDWLNKDLPSDYIYDTYTEIHSKKASK